jgi:hypothetical protein
MQILRLEFPGADVDAMALRAEARGIVVVAHERRRRVVSAVDRDAVGVADVEIRARRDESRIAIERVRLRKRSRLHAIAFGCHD